MNRLRVHHVVFVCLCWLMFSCGPRGLDNSPGATTEADEWPVHRSFSRSGSVALGEPLALVIGFENRVVIGDASPGRIVTVDASSGIMQEYQTPPAGPSFYPTDVGVLGFFVYAVDETGRRLLRFDNRGGYRDVLVDFNSLIDGRRVSPYSLAVDASGRLAITDVENHQVLLLGLSLQVELSFGGFGSYDGQLDSPLGVAFSSAGDFIVTDTGNRRVAIFDDGGSFRRNIPSDPAGNPLVRPRRAIEDASGGLVVADPGAGAVFMFSPGGRLTGALRPVGAVEFEPTDVALDRAGYLYVTDTANKMLYVFKVI